ncbi:MAG: TrmH family RNA methyltransferase [Thermoanaerobaculum sp.]
MVWTPVGKHNPRVAMLRSFAQGKDEHRTLVDGLKLIRDLWRRGLSPEAVFASEEVAHALTHDPQLASLPTRVPCYQLPRSVLERIAPTQHTQGVVAVFPVPHWEEPQGDLIVFLDRVQDPANVGAVVRVAAALGASSVVCSPGCANPFSPKAVRASAGTSLFFPVLRDVPFPRLLLWSGGRYSWVAAAASGGTPLSQWRPQRPLVLALGNEGQGLDPELSASVTHVVTVPLAHGVESLNVAVACGVLLACLTGACQPAYTG